MGKQPTYRYQPLQPLERKNGTLRFRPNSIVRYLLDNGGHDLNALARLDFPQEDREQFAQLIGYSLSGFGELSYVRDSTYHAAEASTRDVRNADCQRRLAQAEAYLAALRVRLREPIAELFGVHPDDLKLNP